MIGSISQMIGVACLGLGALCAVGWMVSILRAKWPSAIPSPVADAVDSVSDYADETVAAGALAALALLFKRHRDSDAVNQLGLLWARAMAWSEDADEKNIGGETGSQS